MSRLRSLAVAAACAFAPVAGCSIVRPPEERPTRILDLARRLPVVVTSATPGVEIRADGPGGEPGAVLGRTPVTIAELVVEKEIWKHGAEPPPPRHDEPRLERAVDARGTRSTAAGAPLRWTVWVVSAPSAPPRRTTLSLEPAALDRAFARGRIELALDAP